MSESTSLMAQHNSPLDFLLSGVVEDEGIVALDFQRQQVHGDVTLEKPFLQNSGTSTARSASV